MLLIVTVIFLFLNVKLSFANFEPYVVGGNEVPIRMFPHSVYLVMSFKKDNSFQAVSCGGSVVNQKIVLTAAHCLDDCVNTDCAIMAQVGSADHKTPGQIVSQFTINSKYDSYTVSHDIGLACLQNTFKFGTNVKRIVILPKRPVNVKMAIVAGWGLIDEERVIDAVRLKSVKQKLWTRTDCAKYVRRLPETSICGGELQNDNYPAEGDSGSALVVKGFIQVGLVSYKQSSRSKSLIVYTDIEKVYNWIHAKATKLACA